MVIAAVLLLTALTLFVITENGSRRIGEMVIARINQIDGLSLQVGNIEGNLLNGLLLDRVRFGNNTVNASVAVLQASWNPYSLLSGNFYLSDLTLNALDLELLGSDDAETDSLEKLVDQFNFESFGVGVSIDNLYINQAVIRDSQQRYLIQNFAAAIELSQQQLEFTKFELEVTPMTLSGQAVISLTPKIPVQASIDWQYLEPILDLFESASGTARIEGDLTSLSIEHQLLTPLQIRSEGVAIDALGGDSRQIEFLHTADALVLPFDSLSSTEFENVSLNSRIDTNVIELDLKTTVMDQRLPSLDISALGVLQLQQRSLSISELEIAVLEGRIEGAGQLSWADGVSGQASYELFDQAPLAYFEMDIPVNLTSVSSRGEVRYQLSDESQRVDLQIESLDGQLQDYPLRGNGNLSFVDGELQINQLRLETSDNQLNLLGSYGETLEVEWEIVAPELNQFSNALSGSASGSGSIAGTLESPEINGELLIERLQAGALQLQELVASFQGADNDYIANLQITNADYRDGAISETVENAVISVNGNLESQLIVVSAKSESVDLEFSTTGGFTNIEALQWQGEIDRARIESPVGTWSATNAVAISISPQNTSFDNSCWVHQKIELCLQLSPRGSEDYELLATLDNFPLNEFSMPGELTENQFIELTSFPRLPRSISLEGFASANLTAIISRQGEAEVNFSVDADNSLMVVRGDRVTDPNSEAEEATIVEQRYNWERLSLQGNYNDRAWQLSSAALLSQSAVTESDLPLSGSLEASLTIDADRNLSGTTDASFQDLAWLEALLPQISNVQGSLQSSLVITGSLEAPLVAGEIRILQGSFHADRLGVTFHDFESTILGESSGTAQIYGRVTGGEGVLEFSGELADLYGPELQLTASLTGSEFQFIDIPDLSLVVSPQITLSGNTDLLHLAGNLNVPVLNLTMRELPEAAIDVSRDVVVVNYPNDQPELARSISAAQATFFDIPVTAEVNLGFGEQVSLAGFGLQANVEGNLNVQQLEGGSNLTYGELNISSGSYRLYGQNLTVRQGKLLFFGAYDNPALDIRAVREAGEITVGVLMNGTLKNISSQLFSTPVLAENDIISVLVTGQPFSQLGSQSGDVDAVLTAIANLGVRRGESLTAEIGDRLGLDSIAITNTGNIDSSMLTVGKYLTPEVFIRYGVGLFDNQSKVAVDYGISDRVKLQAESGEYQSIDVTYTVER